MIHAYAAFEPKGELKPFEYDPGELGANQVEINVDYCGICHSDISMINNDWEMTTYPIVPGHEVVGRIAAVGSDVSNFKQGDVVGLGWHCAYCNHCPYCESGDQNLCQAATGTIVNHHGGFADKVRADANSVVAIPEGMDVATAGPLFCGGITVFNPLLQYQPEPGSKAAVIGIGGLGHLAVQFLNAWGCDVTAFTSHANKDDEVKKLGAHQTINSRDADAVAKAAMTFDYIISTVNVPLDWNNYIATLKPKGRLHFVGAVQEPLNIIAFGLISGQRQISGSPVGSPASIAKMLEFAHKHNIKPIVETFKMSDVNQAISKLKSGNLRYRAVLSNNP